MSSKRTPATRTVEDVIYATEKDSPTMSPVSRYKKLLRVYLRATKRVKKVIHPALEPEDCLAIVWQSGVWDYLFEFKNVYGISDRQHRKLINAIKLP